MYDSGQNNIARTALVKHKAATAKCFTDNAWQIAGTN